MKRVDIYTDGACSGNPGPGGWAAILIYKGVEKCVSGGEQNTTNNRMEIKAENQTVRSESLQRFGIRCKRIRSTLDFRLAEKRLEKESQQRYRYKKSRTLGRTLRVIPNAFGNFRKGKRAFRQRIQQPLRRGGKKGNQKIFRERTDGSGNDII